VPRKNAISFVIDNVAYVGLGIDFGYNELDDIWKYNKDTDSWSFLCQFPGGAREYAFVFVIDDKAYIGGGVHCSKAFWVFDQSSNQWEQKKDCPESTGYSGVGFSIGSKGYILSDEGFSEGHLYEYNPDDDNWNIKSSFPGYLNYPTAFVTNQKAYVGISGYSREIWIYEPISNSWSLETIFPGKAWRSSKTILIEKIAYIIGGWTDNEPSKEVWGYNTNSKSWQQLDDFIKCRYGPIYFTINNIGYYGTGTTETNDMWKFAP